MQLTTGKKNQLHHIFTSYGTAQSNPATGAKDHGACSTAARQPQSVP